MSTVSVMVMQSRLHPNTHSKSVYRSLAGIARQVHFPVFALQLMSISKKTLSVDTASSTF
jgi:hypothetical protein